VSLALHLGRAVEDEWLGQRTQAEYSS
jgi:hypothetical protein